MGGWYLAGTLESAKESEVSFPYYLSLAKFACLCYSQWTLLPICSCCLMPTALSPCRQDNIIFDGLDLDPASLAAQLLFDEHNGCKILACPNILNCRGAHSSVNASAACECFSNVAILFPSARTLQVNLPQCVKYAIKADILSLTHNGIQ